MVSRSLHEYIERQAGGALRAIGAYDEDDYELAYVRDDIDQATVRERLDAIHDRLTRMKRPTDTPVDAQLGRAYATVELRDQAVIVHLTRRDDRGVVIGLEPEIARDLNTFVLECLVRLDPEGIDASDPAWL